MAVNTSINEVDFSTIELGLGAMPWMKYPSSKSQPEQLEKDFEQAFKVSISAGIKLIDTAEVYGGGSSELFLGKFLKSTPTPAFIATKFMPYPWIFSRHALMRSLEASLDRLGLECVDLYQIHWPFPPRPVEFWVEELAKVINKGMVRKAGVSNYNLDQMQRAISILAKYDLSLASNQVQYHLLNRKVEKNGLLDRCKELGVRLIAWAPLASGLLTGKYTLQSPPHGLRTFQTNSRMKDLSKLISLMMEIGQSHAGKTPAQVALNWLICKGALPIPGAKNAKQAAENSGAAGWQLTSEEIFAMDKASDKFSP
jgi:aryl-alcohol dehydrogenase-like predicted oxidoreductase